MSLKIYYLDDEPDLLVLFTETFSAPGREISTFSDSKVAIEKINKNKPDILFLDYRMPNFTGDQIAQMLDPSIPKYLITGDIQVNTDYKFKAVIKKPYSTEEIEKILVEMNQLKKAT